MNQIYKSSAGLMLAVALLFGGKLWGAHQQREKDATADLAAYNKAVTTDSLRVRSIDTGTLKLDVDYHAAITLVIKTQSANVEEQAHVIHSTPSLAQCQLPADLVRLRSEQAAASAALADTGTSP